MEEIVSNPEVDSCYFAAPSEINGAILDRLSPAAKANIARNLKCNVVNATKNDLIDRFLN